MKKRRNESCQSALVSEAANLPLSFNKDSCLLRGKECHCTIRVESFFFTYLYALIGTFVVLVMFSSFLGDTQGYNFPALHYHYPPLEVENQLCQHCAFGRNPSLTVLKEIERRQFAPQILEMTILNVRPLGYVSPMKKASWVMLHHSMGNGILWDTISEFDENWCVGFVQLVKENCQNFPLSHHLFKMYAHTKHQEQNLAIHRKYGQNGYDPISTKISVY